MDMIAKPRTSGKAYPILFTAMPAKLLESLAQQA
jgi:hypothetical protein